MESSVLYATLKMLKIVTEPVWLLIVLQSDVTSKPWLSRDTVCSYSFAKIIIIIFVAFFTTIF